MDFRIGFGYDIHRLMPGSGFLLGSVFIPCDFAIDAHSDGDIVFHSLAQALFSALSLEDIGTYFPDQLKETQNMDSSLLVKKALHLMKEQGYRISNVTLSIVLEKPKLKPYKEEIKKKVSEILSLETNRIAIHANTSELVGPVGKSEAIECYCQLLIYKEERGNGYGYPVPN